ncbi:hypothetical protein SELMODRAFT_410351 [Selaginella moellendorffii]|uniref:Uncharacterized protein n=1 Tax=Selaginella moellendorffii TaxID=88036 RepID=D8REH5_SELML|nr:hypothetical protein SELMODRAFT_410351 [Selaginella moellendorffii]
MKKKPFLLQPLLQQLFLQCFQLTKVSNLARIFILASSQAIMKILAVGLISPARIFILAVGLLGHNPDSVRWSSQPAKILILATGLTKIKLVVVVGSSFSLAIGLINMWSKALGLNFLLQAAGLRSIRSWNSQVLAPRLITSREVKIKGQLLVKIDMEVELVEVVDVQAGLQVVVVVVVIQMWKMWQLDQKQKGNVPRIGHKRRFGPWWKSTPPTPDSTTTAMGMGTDSDSDADGNRTLDSIGKKKNAATSMVQAMTKNLKL